MRSSTGPRQGEAMLAPEDDASWRCHGSLPVKTQKGSVRVHAIAARAVGLLWP
jgi:hypothetical protein